MLPFQPPLPTAWNFAFQPDMGSHTSILMSESLDGVSVAVTRQKAGSLAKIGSGPLAGCAPGAVNVPAATGCALVTFALGRLSAAIDSQVAASAGDAHAHRTINETRGGIRFMPHSWSGSSRTLRSIRTLDRRASRT